MRTILLTLVVTGMGLAAALMVLMARRRNGSFGLAGLSVATCAGMVALLYAAIGED